MSESRVHAHVLKMYVCLYVALSSTANGLCNTTEQLNQVALMGPIYPAKHSLSHQLNELEDS